MNTPEVNIEYSDDPLKVFQQFFDEYIINHIAEQTNIYGAQYIESHELSPRSRVRKWKEATTNEIYILLAFMILQGKIITIFRYT